MVIAVTGGFGFLGSRIVSQAEVDGHRAVALGRPDHEIPSPGFTAELREAAPDTIVHAAGSASVARSVDDPEGDRARSVDVFAEVLTAAAGLEPKPRVTLISSAAVYGQPARLPVSEDDGLEPISPYGSHRVECEQLLLGHHRDHGVPTCALRVFSAYGDGLRRQLLWDIARRAVVGPTVELGGTGDETRDFVHGDDVARAAMLVAGREDHGHEAVNIASGTETSVREVATGLLDALGLADRRLIFSGSERAGDPTRWRADISLLEGWGWAPEVPLDAGLARYAAWALAELS